MRLRLFDNGGRTVDRYTAVFMDSREDGWRPDPQGRPVYTCLSMSDDPNHPCGVSQMGTAVIGRHLGREIDPGQLPDAVREHLERRLAPEAA